MMKLFFLLSTLTLFSMNSYASQCKYTGITKQQCDAQQSMMSDFIAGKPSPYIFSPDCNCAKKNMQYLKVAVTFFYTHANRLLEEYQSVPTVVEEMLVGLEKEFKKVNKLHIDSKRNPALKQRFAQEYVKLMTDFYSKQRKVQNYQANLHAAAALMQNGLKLLSVFKAKVDAALYRDLGYDSLTDMQDEYQGMLELLNQETEGRVLFDDLIIAANADMEVFSKKLAKISPFGNPGGGRGGRGNPPPRR